MIARKRHSLLLLAVAAALLDSAFLTHLVGVGTSCLRHEGTGEVLAIKGRCRFAKNGSGFVSVQVDDRESQFLFGMMKYPYHKVRTVGGDESDSVVTARAPRGPRLASELVSFKLARG